MEQVRNRDARILEFLAKNGFASVRGLEREFFGGIAHRNHYRSIVRLSDKGLVERLLGDGDEILGYKLSRKGLRLLKAIAGEKFAIQKPPQQFRTQYDHDELLIGIRSIFEKCPAVSAFQSEQTVREHLARSYGYSEKEGAGYKVPDAIFELKTPNGEFKVALELELTQKSKLRYRKILKQLALSQDWDTVFFISKDQTISNAIQGTLKDLRVKDAELSFAKNSSGFYFANLTEFEREKENCAFLGEGKSFSLRELSNKTALNAQVQLTTESSVPFSEQKTKTKTN
jgi:hypothetical protein